MGHIECIIRNKSSRKVGYGSNELKHSCYDKSGVKTFTNSVGDIEPGESVRQIICSKKGVAVIKFGF